MKKWFSLSLALILLVVCFSTAYAQSEQSSWPEYESIVNEPVSAIMSIHFSFSTEGGVQEAAVTDSTAIEEICALIQGLSVVGESEMGVQFCRKEEQLFIVQLNNQCFCSHRLYPAFCIPGYCSEFCQISI